MEVIEKSPLETEEPCPHFGMCGGCTYQTVPYEKQLDMKLTQVKKLISDAIGTEKESGYEFIGIHGSPKKSEYRNKMEFSFGDEYKDGPLALGMHKRGSFYDLVTVSDCQIVDEDFRTILKVTLDYFSKTISHISTEQHTRATCGICLSERQQKPVKSWSTLSPPHRQRASTRRSCSLALDMNF